MLAYANVPDETVDAATSRGRYRIALGCSVVLVALVGASAILGFAAGDHLGLIIKPTVSDAESEGRTTPPEAGQVIAELCISLILAVGGALFFLANLMHEGKLAEEFIEVDFWGTLWFRIGEAILFTIVLFYLIYSVSPGSSIVSLPLSSLLLGMFIPLGETLVFNIAKRLVRSLVALVGSDEDSAIEQPTLTDVVWRVVDGDIHVQVVATKLREGEKRRYVVEIDHGDGTWRNVAQFSTTAFSFQRPEGLAPLKLRVVAINQTGWGGPFSFDVP